jgi:hypothetical protein
MRVKEGVGEGGRRCVRGGRKDGKRGWWERLVGEGGVRGWWERVIVEVGSRMWWERLVGEGDKRG